MKRMSYLGAAMCCLVPVLVALPVHAQLADSPWPMFHGNAHHTGRSAYAGPQTGTPLWSYGYGYTYSSPVIGSDGSVYMGSSANNIYCLSSAGALIWRYPIGNAYFSASASPAIGFNGRVYVAPGDGNIYCLSSAGALIWRYPTGTHGGVSVTSSPAIDSNGRVYVGPGDGSIYCLSSAGALLWSYPTGAYHGVTSSPAIGSGGKVYVGSGDNSIYCLSSAGALLWSYQAGDGVDSSPAIGSGGNVYVGSWDNSIYCLRSAGALLWSYRAGDDVESSPAIDSDGRVYAGAEDSSIYCLSSLGVLLWSYQAGGSDVTSSPAIDSDGRVYVGLGDGNFYCFNSDGSLLWTYPNCGSTGSSPAIGSDGKVFVGGPSTVCFYDQNRITLNAKRVGGKNVTLTYHCEFKPYDYSGVPVNIYLGATAFTPETTSSVTCTSPNACSIDEFLNAGDIYILDKKFRVYQYKKPNDDDDDDDDDDDGGKIDNGPLQQIVHSRSPHLDPQDMKPGQETGGVKEPTWSAVSFPPVPISGSVTLPNVPDNITIRFGVVLLRSSNWNFLRTDGLPVEMSNCVGPALVRSTR